jgi:hypothetical protein
MDILRFKPVGYFILDNTSGNATDLSGYGITSTISATDRGPSLSSNAVMSTYGNAPAGTTGLSFAQELWLRGRERESASVAVTILPVNPDAAVKVPVLVPAANDEGIWIQGTTISFGTRFTNTGIAQCDYDFEFAQRLVVLAVHTPAKNSLYVNGELVAEVDITPEQQADTLKNTVASQTIGGGTSNIATALFNEVAFFESALGGDDAKKIYDEQTRGLTINIPATYGGEKIPLSTLLRVPALSFVWKDSKDWDRAMQVNCIVDDNYLYPEVRDGLSVASQWLSSVNMYKGATSITVTELNVDYAGYGCTVSVSLDGVNWTLANGTVAMTFDPYDKDLYVKVDFAAGIEDAYLDNLYINAYTSNVVTTQNSRTVTYNAPATALREYPPQRLHSKWGVKVGTGGTVVISHTTSINTTEFWIKPDTDGTVASWRPFSGTSGQHYINGLAKASTTVLKAGIWYHVMVAETTTRAGYTFKAGATYGTFSIYEATLTATQVANIYRMYNGPISAPVSDSSALALTESATPVVIYATDYAVLAG